MHFCPSINCRKWYHSNCLVLRQSLDTISHPATRAIRLLANDPDSAAPFVMFGHFAEPESRDIVPDSTEQVSIIAYTLVLSLVPFPKSVVRVVHCVHLWYLNIVVLLEEKSESDMEVRTPSASVAVGRKRAEESELRDPPHVVL